MRHRTLVVLVWLVALAGFAAADQLAGPGTRPSSSSLTPRGAGTGLRILVGGPTAIQDDFATVLAGKLPLFIAVVVVLAFLLLVMVFRSLLIPLVASVMNLLSVGAALGLLNVVFARAGATGCSGCPGVVRSRSSSRCCCSRSCSGCPWTTRCSWSAGCTSTGC